MLPDEADAERDDVHVMPTYGREHESTRRCWCDPVRDDEEPHLWVHRDAN